MPFTGILDGEDEAYIDSVTTLIMESASQAVADFRSLPMRDRKTNPLADLGLKLLREWKYVVWPTDKDHGFCRLSVEDAKALEGYCGDPTGAESEMRPCTIFNSASARAALKLKYKPKIVDGKATSVEGVLHRFTFIMADDD